MALELTGRIGSILEPETGESRAGQPWIKQTFSVVYGDEIEREAAFTLFGENKVGLLKSVQEGDSVRVSFSVQSRRGSSAATENKFFTDLNAWKIVNLSSEHRQTYSQPAAQPAAPKASQPTTTAPTTPVQNSTLTLDEEEGLNLPF